MLLRRIFILFFFLLLKFWCFSQDSIKNIIFIPEGILFKPLLFDPTESQYYGGLFLLNDSGKWNEEVYIPITLVINKPVLRFEHNDFSWEFGFEGDGFTQFDIKKIDRKTALGKMLNTDFRGGVFFNFSKSIYSTRIRLFHSSSHLADDYILKNEVSPRTPSELDYEQVDITIARQINNARMYLGSGMVVSPNTVRKRFSVQTGGYYIRSFANSFAFLMGTDIKIFQQNDYRPNIKLGVGIRIGNNLKIPLNLVLEYYNGHLPYSTLEYRIVQWFGISLSFKTQ